MDSLATNEEQAVRADGDEWKVEDDEVVVNRREFFKEVDEVRSALQRAVCCDVEFKLCRQTCERVGDIWTQYQEQPGLLDPFLEEMIEPLIGAVGHAVRESPRSPVKVMPTVHLLSSLLYLLTTVRGYKTVSRFFPHEAADLEPCLEAAEAEAALASTDTWSTLYCLMLWLAMVLLTPFDLQSIDSGGTKGLATRILELGLKGLQTTSRIRDASAWMLAKYFTRPDVTVAGSLKKFKIWTTDVWSPTGLDGDDSSGGAAGLSFTRCGALQAWCQTLKAAPRAVLRPVWNDVVNLALKGPSGQGGVDFGSSSTLRKLRVKVACRAALVALPPRLASWRYERGARSLLVNFAQATGGSAAEMASTAQSVGGPGDEEDEDEEDVPEEVEEVVELLLACLSDADTVVRWSAAKGVGRVTNRLSRDFGDQVLESLLDRCFSFRETDKAWHGGCLALAELTRRGLLLPERLPTVVPLVCQALHFEQVTGNHAVGQHVRDAACYVCWAFARAYAPDVLEPFVADIANALIQVAVFDREINCRRAAAAAVQEHVGRQGTFPNGIDVVTIADYWTLSSRRHAYLVVAPQLAALGTYRRSLIDHLVDRKLHHQDLQIRLLASQALAKLAENASDETTAYLNEAILPKLLARALEGLSAPVRTSTSNTGTGYPETTAAPVAVGSGPAGGTVASRHGAVAAVSALVEVLQGAVTSDNQNAVRALVPNLEKARAYRGRGGEVVRQVACNLLSCIAAATAWPFKDATSRRYLQTIDECVRHTTDAVQVSAVDALQTLAHLRCSPELRLKCVENYIGGLKRPDENIAARRGYALCLGALPHAEMSDSHVQILEALCVEIKGVELPGGKDQEDPQTRQYAVLSLGRLCMDAGLTQAEVESVVSALEVAMGDYAVDRRGDVGSWVREVAVEVIACLLDAQRRGATAPALKLPGADMSTQLVARLLQQAVEKIDRLRERAYTLLHHLVCTDAVRPLSLEMAHRRVCHGEPYDSASLQQLPALSVSDAAAEAGSADSKNAWPPAHIVALRESLSGIAASRTVANTDDAVGGDGVDPDAAIGDAAERCDRNAAIFDALVPLISCEAYRPAIVAGLVVSVGGITEYTAKDAKKAFLKYLQEVEPTLAMEVCRELLRIFERTSPKDTDPDGRRVLAPLFSTIGILFAQECFPASLAVELLDCTLTAVRSCRDLTRLRSSISVFVGLLKWPGTVRRKAMSSLLQFLGYSFPTIRQATAQALYIRLLEEQGDFDLSPDGVHEGDAAEAGSTELAAASAVIPAAVVAEVLELISVTPWGTDNEEALATALRQVYAQLHFDLPSGGRSILAPKRPEKKPKEIDYADLVRANHY